jgi:hypothetical protein
VFVQLRRALTVEGGNSCSATGGMLKPSGLAPSSFLSRKRLAMVL